MLPNPNTRKTYCFVIKDVCGGDPDAFLTLARSDKAAAEKALMDWIIRRREELSPATLGPSIATVKSFLEYEDAILNWKKVRRALPAARRFGRDRAPSIEEIRKLLEVCNHRLTAAVLIMASSGIRVGAFDYLSIGDYSRLPSGIGRLVIYHGEPEECFTYISPEAVAALDAYLDDRRRAGEELKPGAPLIRESMDMMNSVKRHPKWIGSQSIKRDLYNLWVRVGVKNNGAGRGEFKTCHGFRKFFKTRAERTMKTLHVEMLLGHATGLNNNYYRPAESELESAYLKAVNDLTISELLEVKKAVDLDRIELKERFTREKSQQDAVIADLQIQLREVQKRLDLTLGIMQQEDRKELEYLRKKFGATTNPE